MKHVLVSLLFIIAVSPLLAQTSEIYKTDAGAIGGYDPVAYFKVGKPVQGSKDLAFEYKGATWHFSTQENLQAFKANPDKFAPQYGGYCAYGMSKKHKANTEPDAWSIVNDKLYFNYNKNVQVEWKKDQQGLIQQADANWPTVKGSK